MSTNRREDPLDPQTWNTFRVQLDGGRDAAVTLLADGKYILYVGTPEAHVGYMIGVDKLREWHRQIGMALGLAKEQRRGSVEAS